MESVNEIRDFDTNLNLVGHIRQITNKDMKELGFVNRTAKDFYSLDVIEVMYLSLVSCLLEYNYIVWSPHSSKFTN